MPTKEDSEKYDLLFGTRAGMTRFCIFANFIDLLRHRFHFFTRRRGIPVATIFENALAFFNIRLFCGDAEGMGLVRCNCQLLL
jgi:hypothetical protein